MTFTRYFKASSYCLIASGFAAIAATGSFDPVTIVFFTSILAVSWFLDTAAIRRRIPSWILNLLALAYLPFFAADYLLLSHSLIIALVHLILFSAAVKLLTLSKDSDYFILYLVSFAELIAASTLTVNILFGICFLLFLISGISTLILFEMRRSNASLPGHAIVQPLVVAKSLRGTPWELFSPFPAKLLFAMTLGIALLIIAIAVPVFFLLPRISFGLQRQPSGKTQFITGFSERVELGKIGTIEQSDAVVMRVRLANAISELPAGLKWRGIAFDHYDGRVWSRSDLYRKEVLPQERFYKLETQATGANLLVQTFFLEALSTDVIFAAYKPLAVSHDVGRLQRDSAEGLYAARPPSTKLRYSAVSDPIRANPVNIQNWDSVPAETHPMYLQIPPLDPRIAGLAKQATRQASGKYAQAQALERFLRSQYEYSLELPRIPNNKDPLSVFLFETRKGHCEYFASAMVIMLRHLGIPARLVNGFLSGEYNNIGRNWTVRRYDAHSWVEAYFAPYGWLEFDPTPPDFQPAKPAALRFLSNLTDVIDLWWWESVVNYDSSKQYQAISILRGIADDFQRGSTTVLENGLEKIRMGANLLKQKNLESLKASKWIIWIPAAAIIAWLIVRRWRREFYDLLGRSLRRSPRSIAHSFYVDALGLLSEKGMERSRGQTPLEFARSLEGHPAGAPFLALTNMYNAARFGPPEKDLSLSEGEALLRLLRDSLRAQKSI
jgi:protein-glutamine gamma-glutamyltransferase